MFENRHDPILLGDVPRNRSDNVVGNLLLAEIDHLCAEMRRFGLGDIRWTDELVGDHQIHQANPGRFRLRSQRRDLLRADEPEVNQDIN